MGKRRRRRRRGGREGGKGKRENVPREERGIRNFDGVAVDKGEATGGAKGRGRRRGGNKGKVGGTREGEVLGRGDGEVGETNIERAVCGRGGKRKEEGKLGIAVVMTNLTNIVFLKGG